MQMTDKPWVKACGTVEENGLAALLRAYPVDGCWAAFYTDRFNAGRTDAGIPADEPENLLELRVFGAAGELWLCRSRVGQPFRWRLAVDAGDYTEDQQLLDIAARDGCRLTATGGGRYTLPVAEGDTHLLLHTYIDYDPESGMAFAADTRWVGFGKGAL